MPTGGPALSGQTADATAKMPSWKAARILMKDPDIARLVRQHAYEKHRNVHQIDADIAVLKSHSLMAKVTFQRQRDVEKAINYETSNQRWELFSIVGDKVGKLMGVKWSEE